MKVAVLVACGALAVALLALQLPRVEMARAPAAPAAAAPAESPARPFELYMGLEPRRVRSTSRIEAAQGRHAFPPVLQGDVLHHDFLIRNPGDAPMELREVRMCSGCILDGHSKTIEPGREGRISLVVPTDWLGGQELTSTLSAETSAPELPRIEVEVSITVREFAALLPYRVWLKGTPGSRIVETCRVVPNEAYPFSITGIKARKGVWFEHAWREVEHEGRRAYEITLENTRSKPGPYQDVLFVQTDHPERPELRIRVEGRIEP